MSQPSQTAELPVTVSDGPDPELEALPEPRRPGRRPTLFMLAVTGVLSLGMAWALSGEARYALVGGQPVEVGNLAAYSPSHENQWVHGEGLLAASGAIRYERPLESDSYRLAQVAGNERLWVEVGVPEGMEGPRFVPPTSFVGRLVPMHEAGLRHRGLDEAVSEKTDTVVPADAWLLIDGEAPATTRWALGLVALFLGFAAFNVWGLIRLLRPVKEH